MSEKQKQEIPAEVKDEVLDQINGGDDSPIICGGTISELDVSHPAVIRV